MSMTTALRFESGNLGQTLQKSLEREHQRILKDEQQAQRVKDINLDVDSNLKAEWAENLEEASMKKMYKINLDKIKHELDYGKKSFVMVRRAALQELLEKEHKQYEMELRNMEKAFYVKRT
ncbi:uncharacterized protein LOC120341387 [Styela clava]